MQHIPKKALYEAEFSVYIQECWCAGIRLLLVPVCPQLNLSLQTT